MTTNLIEVPVEMVPRGRGSNPFIKSVEDTAIDLIAKPYVWHIIGSGSDADRSRLNNAAASLSGGKYKALAQYANLGRFETRVSGAKNAPHRAKFDIGVYARFIPGQVSLEEVSEDDVEAG